jgi:hypothetical protein
MQTRPEAEKQGRKHYPHPPCRFRAGGDCAERKAGGTQIARFGAGRYRDRMGARVAV